ncbi:GHKL domain-containing protein [Lachnotalea glycerini]|uniref:ATP-binding protein n=1 Tax=Lachnotalea glycerini TaxID=1763509 RepID=A0A255ILN4_9FIRM|nr:sensor histidine kinase [Lachnotalea glycerini]PXV95628.1 GHKL domain-containing protein [Lachnotalea glycerini]RDY32918.1 ATP-binding protein [Lachnotalea glycerini]
MELLDKFILFAGCVAEVYMVFDFYNNFFNIRKIVKSQLVIIIISILIITLLFVVNLFGKAYLNLSLFPIILWIYVTILFDTDIGTRLIYLVISISIIVGCEFIFVILLKIPSYFVKQTSFMELTDITWQVLKMKLLTYILFTILKQVSSKSKNKLSGKIFLMYLCVPIASLCILLITYYSGVDFSDNIMIKVMMLICFCFMLIGNVLMFYAFNIYEKEVYNGIQQKSIIMKKDVELKYYIQITEVNEENKRFIHNSSNYLKVIGELAKAYKIENILEIVKELNIELENNEMKIYSGTPVLNAILSAKGLWAKKQSISFDVYVEPVIHLGNVTDSDLITILGNLLDNAIRAAASCENNKSVKVRIFMQNEGNFCVIKITNRFTGKLCKTEGGFLTTKEERGIHGIGLKSVESIVKKYNGYLNCFIEDKEFQAIVFLSL